MRRCSVPPLRCDTDQYQRYGRYAPSLSDNVVELALIVGDTRAHLALERFHWQDFDTDVYVIANVERQVLDEQVNLHCDCRCVHDHF
jgi:hypothetical protein